MTTKRCLMLTGRSAARLGPDHTERLLAQDMRNVQLAPAEPGRHGSGLSIGDFSVGDFSLNYLKRLSIDALKIDCSLVVKQRSRASAG